MLFDGFLASCVADPGGDEACNSRGEGRSTPAPASFLLVGLLIVRRGSAEGAGAVVVPISDRREIHYPIIRPILANVERDTPLTLLTVVVVGMHRGDERHVDRQILPKRAVEHLLDMEQQ